MAKQRKNTAHHPRFGSCDGEVCLGDRKDGGGAGVVESLGVRKKMSSQNANSGDEAHCDLKDHPLDVINRHSYHYQPSSLLSRSAFRTLTSSLPRRANFTAHSSEFTSQILG